VSKTRPKIKLTYGYNNHLQEVMEHIVSQEREEELPSCTTHSVLTKWARNE